MKWKGKIWIFDNIIPKEHQEKIRDTLLGHQFDWHFVDDVTDGGVDDKRPAFAHTFVKRGMLLSKEEYLKMLEPLWMAGMEKVMEKTGSKGNYSAVAARTFLQVPLGNLSKREYDAHHIDQFDEHFAFLYYVCDADGDTVLFENMYSASNPNPPPPKKLKEKVRVTPKQGRMVIFDGYYWHTATQPTKGPRCVINTDIVQLPDQPA